MAGTQHRYRQLTCGILLALGALASSPIATAALPTGAAVAPLVQPTWDTLTDNQKTILAPLQSEWDTLELQRRIKWLGIAERYPSMQPEEQDRIRKQMVNWARLSPEERKLAREKYKNLKQVAPDQKEVIKQKWNEYQELSEEEKRDLKKQAKEKKPPKSQGNAPIKPLSQPPALKLAPTSKHSALAPTDWPNIIPGPVPPAGTTLYPLPGTPAARK